MNIQQTSNDGQVVSQDHIPSLLVIGGTQRGGTSLLMEFINAHPLIDLFPRENRSLSFYGLTTYVHLIAVGQKLLVLRRSREFSFDSKRVILRYLMQILKETSLFGFVTLDTIHTALINTFADEDTLYVGAKYPAYLLDYPRFIHRDNTKCIFIYRDARDVIASNLMRVRHDWWKHFSWVEQFNTIEKLCQYWLLAMDCIHDIQRLNTNVLIIRYEDFVSQPQAIANQIGEHLNLDPSLFSVNEPNTSSIGKHVEMLTAQEIALIEDITGDMMRTFGYL
jgi:hypothetical protein